MLYAERQETLITAAARDLAGAMDVARSPAGMHLLGWLPPRAHDSEASRKAAAAGIHAPPLSAYAAGPIDARALLLGYAGVTPREIREGVRKLAAAMLDFSQ
jgi:GntR family transcriptional regulator/MocR family aminotransferase